MSYITIGRQLTLPAGTIVKTSQGSTKRKVPSIVTVRRTESARDGKTRVFWKSNGYIVSALVK